MKKIPALTMVVLGSFWLIIAAASFNSPQELPSYLRFEGIWCLMAVALGVLCSYYGVKSLAKDKFSGR